MSLRKFRADHLRKTREGRPPRSAQTDRDCGLLRLRHPRTQATPIAMRHCRSKSSLSHALVEAGRILRLGNYLHRF